MAQLTSSNIAAALQNLVGAAKPQNQTIVIGPTSNPSLLSEILQGLQAGALAVTSVYQSQQAINSAQAQAEAAKYYANQQALLGAGVTYQPTQTDLTPILLIGGGLLLVMMMMDKKR